MVVHEESVHIGSKKVCANKTCCVQLLKVFFCQKFEVIIYGGLPTFLKLFLWRKPNNKTEDTKKNSQLLQTDDGIADETYCHTLQLSTPLWSRS